MQNTIFARVSLKPERNQSENRVSLTLRAEIGCYDRKLRVRISLVDVEHYSMNRVSLTDIGYWPIKQLENSDRLRFRIELDDFVKFVRLKS